MDADNNEESYHNSEDEIDASLPATPARRLSDLGSLESQKKQGSFVWKYFQKDENFKDNKRATCTHCKKIYTCSGSSTTNLTKHLKTAHSIQQQGSQPTGANVLEMLNAPKWSYDHNKMINKLVKWIVINQHAFTTVEEQSFLDFIYTLYPTAKIPSADTIKSYISNFYKADKEKIQNILLDVPGKISFTTDCWTSPSIKSFLSITAHFINKDWVLQHILLDFIEMHDSHSGQNLKETFVAGLEHFLIKEKLMGITLDNASNNTAFIRLLTNWAIENRIPFDKDDNHFRCFAHVINLSVQSAITCLDSEISKLRDLTNKIRASTLRREKLQTACKNNQLKELALISDVPTRWNSTYDMISRSLQLKIAIESVVLNDRDLKKYLLTENQWTELEKIKNFLYLFKEVTTIMSGFTYPTLSATIPLYNILIDHVENVIGDDDGEVNENVDDNESAASSENENEDEWSQIIKNAAKICKSKLLEYYNKTSSSYLISTILDPRLKLQYYKDNEWGDELINDIQQKFLNIYEGSYAAPIRSDQTENLNKEKSVMQLLFKRRRVGTPFDEYQAYLSLPQIDGEDDPLEWWKQNAQQFPNLAKMARDFLSIPATSVPSEQVFSTAKNLITDKRNRLVGKTVRMCLCLKSWWSSSSFINN